jgi:flagellar basal body-associated protein FliL
MKMKKKYKIILALFVLVCIVGFVSYNYIMTGGARDLTSEKTDFKVSSKDIISEFTTNIEAANKKYLEKAVAIEGTITKITDKEIILDNSIICEFKETDKTIKENQTYTIKGRIMGYDDLMSELKLDQCFINN